MINAVLNIKLLAPEEWHVLRTTRLRALGDSPSAFISPRDVEACWTEGQWRQLLAAARWVVAIESGVVVGIAGVFDGPPGDTRHIGSIWVQPTHRRLGVFRALLRVLVDQERANGTRELALWVLEDNHDAQQAYARLGFVYTGERQPSPRGDRHELRLRLRITAPGT